MRKDESERAQAVVGERKGGVGSLEKRYTYTCS